MKNFFLLLTFFGALALMYFQFPQVQRFVYYSPCDTPISYKIGSIDSRFKLSQNELKSDLAQAAKIWSDTEHKELFKFDPQGQLTVNLVYDERQYLSSQLDQLGNSVGSLSKTVNNLESSLSSKQKDLNQEVAQFQSQVDDFKKKLAQYNSDVSYWNTQGGAPPDQYNKLQQTQKDLQSQQQTLSQQESKIRMETKNYNGDVAALNQTIGDYNQQVGTLKSAADTFNQTVQLHPEEGLFNGSNASGQQTIDIYYNISHAELVHTLAHEMGHALGMNHNQTKVSIMYPYTTDVLTPSVEDRVSLVAICQKQTAVTILWNRLLSLKAGN